MRISSILLLAVLSSTMVLGQTPKGQQQKNSLKDLTGLLVVIEKFDKQDINEEGLSEASLKTDIELRLRKANITVLSEEEWTTDPRNPHLYVAIALLSAREPWQGLYAVNISVEVRQSVITMGPHSIETMATTWNDSFVGTVGKRQLPSLRSWTADLVDEVINDYLAVNSKNETAKRVEVKLPTAWKSLTSGSTKIVSVSGDNLLFSTLLTPSQDATGCLSMAYLKKKEQIYSGVERFDCVCTRRDPGYAGTVKRFTIERQIELNLITPTKIEGRVLMESDDAKFDCANEKYDKSQTWHSFAWIPN